MECGAGFSVERSGKGFCLDEKESLQGMTVADVRLAGCLHTSRITTDSVNTLIRVSFSARGF